MRSSESAVFPAVYERALQINTYESQISESNRFNTADFLPMPTFPYLFMYHLFLCLLSVSVPFFKSHKVLLMCDTILPVRHIVDCVNV
jgi:hypothetical protein